jgi:predicted CoA-binding protein
MTIDARPIIDEFLAQKRIAFVGVSRDPNAFSRKLFQEFRRHGYEMLPVNPNAAEIDGLPCRPHVLDIQPPPDAAVLMTSRENTYHALLDCEQAGIRRVWLHGNSGPRDVSVGAMEFCASHGIQAVPGYCPFMFLPKPGFVHRIHACIMRLVGSYPKQSAS